MQESLIQLVNQHPYVVYGIIVIVSFIEGPVLAMLCGLLVRLGDISLIPVYAALMVGDLIGDIFWYYVGYFWGHRFIKRFGKFFSVTEEGVATVSAVFHTYKNYILLISKITMGFGFALVTLITAGIVKIPFKKYLALNVVGQLVWTGILLCIGYFIGHAYTIVDSIFAKASLIALFIIIFMVFIGYGKYMRKQVKSHIQS